MNFRSVASALGAGITTFLVVAVLVIELLDFEFSAIVGLPVGLLAGLVASSLLLAEYDDLGSIPRTAVDALAGFGYGFIALLAVSYVNLVTVGFETRVGVAAAVAVLGGIGSWLVGRGRQ